MMIWLTYLQDASSSEALSGDLGSLYEPPPVDFTFETVGWTILLVCALITFLLIIILLVRKHNHNRYRYEAMSTLERVRHPGDTQLIFITLKQVAIKTFGREKVAPLFGREWLIFLEETGREISFLPYEKEISQAIYREEVIGEDTMKELLAISKKWIRTHAS